MKTHHHALGYLEFNSRDLPKAKKFYSSVFGWTFTDYGPDYAAFESGGASGGFAKGEPAGGSILPVIYSERLEETKEKVAKAGGTIVKDIFSFPGGRRFHFADPDGNELAVWSEA